MSAYMDVPVPNMCRPKHQILILKTYPKFQKNAAEIRPNTSELSYLLYYVSTRRSKLPKVGAFLERRVARDVYKRRTGNVQVTLEICRALIEKCPRDLNVYAFNILTILKTVIASKDIALIEETLPCWEAFCSHHDGANLASDEPYVRLFEEVIRLYADCASNPPVGHELRWRSVGLKAIRSSCSSEALSSANAKQQLAIVLPVILKNVYSEDGDHLDELQYRITTVEATEEKRNALVPRVSIGTVDGAMANTAADADKLEQQDIEVLALQSLKGIFEVNNLAQIRFATQALLRYVTSRPNVAETWITSLIEMVAKWAPMQSRFLILVEILETLVACPMAEAELHKQLVYAQLIACLLSSTVNLVGLSVMDVLVAIIAKILQLLQLESKPVATESNGTPPGSVSGERSRASTTTNPAASPSLAAAAIFSITATITEVVKNPSSTRKDLLHKLRNCIADLATHIYYSDQISDIASELLLRLKPSPAAPVTTDPAVAASTGALTEQPNVDDFFSFDTARAVALKSVRDLLTVANLRSQQSIGRNTVPLSVWEGTHWLLREEERGVRKAYIDSISTYLHLEIDRPNTTSDIATALIEINSLNLTPRASKLVSSSFLKLLHVAAFETVIAHAGLATDMVGIYKLLDLLVRKLGLPAVLSGLPMIYKLDEEAASLDTAKQKIAIKSLVLGYIYSVADTWGIEPLRQDTLNTIIERQNAGKWFAPLKVPRGEDDVVDVFDERHVYPETIAEGVLLPREDYSDVTELVMNAISTESETEFPDKLREIFGDGATWSKENVVTSIEAHSSRQTSLVDSRNGLGGMGAQTGTIRSFLTVNGDRKSLNKDANYRSSSRPGTGNLEKFRIGREERFGRSNRSVTNMSTTRSSSSRESTLRADELKRVLSGAIRPGSSRPNTRGGSIRHKRASLGSGGSDSSESMMDMGSYIGSSSDDLSTHGGSEGANRIRNESPLLNGNKRKTSLRSRSSERKTSPMPPTDAEEEKPPVPPLPGHLSHTQSFHLNMPGEFPETPQPLNGTQNKMLENGNTSTDPGNSEPKKDDGLASFSFWDESTNATSGTTANAGKEEFGVTTSPTGAPQIALPVSSQSTPQKAWWESDSTSKYSPNVTMGGETPQLRTPEPASPTVAIAGVGRSLSVNRSTGGATPVSQPNSTAASPAPQVHVQHSAHPSPVDVKGLLSGIGSMRSKSRTRERSGSTLSTNNFRPPY